MYAKQLKCPHCMCVVCVYNEGSGPAMLPLCEPLEGAVNQRGSFPRHVVLVCDVRALCVWSVCTMKAVDLLRCLYVSHLKELSINVDHSHAMQCWFVMWVQPVLDLLTSCTTSRRLKSCLTDVCTSQCECGYMSENNSLNIRCNNTRRN